ncbi:peptidase, partial [Escherichia coli]|nr:peptidase [Escherichia coli]
MQYVLPASSVPQQTHPLFADRCQAGFPSPAGDDVEAELDLNEYYMRHRAPTYFVRATGQSMTDIGLYSGEL